MPFGIDDAIMIGSAALSAGSNAMSSAGDRGESQRQFNFDRIRSLIAQLEQGPMRDRLQYNLGQRLGMSPQEFRPNVGGMFGMQGAPQQGGIDMEELARRRAAYTPGAGGFDQGSREQLLSAIGWKPHPQGGYGYSTGPGMPRPPRNETFARIRDNRRPGDLTNEAIARTRNRQQGDLTNEGVQR